MVRYTAEVVWLRAGQVFTDGRYSRAHTLRFDGGITVKASSSPHIVPIPLSAEEAVDPEEAFIAAIASCHMLWFLSYAAVRGFVVDSYRDQPEGIMGSSENGGLMISVVTLRPQVRFSGSNTPTTIELERLHRLANLDCMIANSVKTKIFCEPR
jgi:organic hydroperoxide reductase OsmC/OhrA